jgi:hypothetical protein
MDATAWNSPVGLTVFFVGLGVTLFLLSLAASVVLSKLK